MNREYFTPQGRQAFYARTILGVRQHLVLGIFHTSTACGHPAMHTSTSPVRTPIGMTCRWCVRTVTRHGVERVAPGARLFYAVAGVWFRVGKPLWRKMKELIR